MGAAIGAVLVENGHEMLWQPQQRSQQTERRARAAGLIGVEDVRDAEVIISVCPPHAALDVARSLQGTRALVIDANAVSPATASRIGELIGDGWVDGGIVGPPPIREETTRLFLSGHRAAQASQLFQGTRLEAVVLSGSPVAASAVKMAYASWTKGSAALLLAALASARATGVEEALRAEWRRSQPGLEKRLQSATESAAAKGWRWVGEMEEIASTFSAAGLPPGFHQAAAEMFDRAQLRSPDGRDDSSGARTP
jgi:3-hydroxyisobutyrate dehydrogenase-like beta-hydroxyacid dehydrogenase